MNTLLTYSREHRNSCNNTRELINLFSSLSLASGPPVMGRHHSLTLQTLPVMGRHHSRTLQTVAVMGRHHSLTLQTLPVIWSHHSLTAGSARYWGATRASHYRLCPLLGRHHSLILQTLPVIGAPPQTHTADSASYFCATTASHCRLCMLLGRSTTASHRRLCRLLGHHHILTPQTLPINWSYYYSYTPRSSCTRITQSLVPDKLAWALGADISRTFVIETKVCCCF